MEAVHYSADPTWMDGTEQDEELVEVLLQGRAPWGFTLRGGTEHREPLVITKVEDGSAAARVRLRAGDRMVTVNGVPLSGSRQEAICLVKGSHKTLALVVRRAKMVDVVSPQVVPSENEVHVARSFLTKILRSSMRKNDPGLRPHSWHSSKLTEEESEPAGSEATPATVWQPKHEARPKESSTPGDQKTQQPNQLGSVNSMEKIERPSHPYPPGCLSPPKYIDSSEAFSGSGAKRDSAFSCFSGNSSPPILDSSMSGRKGTSTENIFFKGLQSEGPQQNERHRYLQSTHGNGGWEGSRVKEQPGSRVSVVGRPSGDPVWQVPEKKKSQSPPPPPPPLRSDSFAATKVFPYSEVPSGPANSHGSSFEKLTESNQNCLRFQKQLHPNKLFSLSSSDVSQSHYAQSPTHQRQYSDESPFYLQTRAAPPAKTQSVGSYYRSLQDLPSNAFSRKHIRHSTAAMAACAANSSLDSGGHSRHFGPSGSHPLHVGELKARQCKPGGWRAEMEKPQWMNSSESGLQSSLKTNIKPKYPTPQSQMSCSENKDRNGNGLHYNHKTYKPSHQSTEEPSKRAEGPPNEVKRILLPHQSNDHKVGPSRHQDPWLPQEDHRISALKTPLLHFLAQESQTLTTERQPAAATKPVFSTQDVCETTTASSGKAGRRCDRYATTLRKEIQQKRAQLQKSRSAATLTYEAEEEDAEEWRSMEASASSNTYKDHLKEAQARVLQATSFQRRDLEPLGPEAPVLKACYGRIRGRRRFHPAKRTHSFSEPDKIDKVGVEGESQPGSEQQRKLFETKPAFPRPVLKTDQDEASRPEETPPSRESDQSKTCTDPNEQSAGDKQVLLEQQRLGTFAEYQANWSKQKKSSDGKTQGRYHSAENILDAGAEDKAASIHERSRSSPSADFYTQNISSHWRDPEAPESSVTTREAAGSRSPDHSPQPDPSEPRNEGIFPGPPDHRTSPSHSSGRRSISPNPESKLPPPRLHLGPETTRSSQEFLAGTQPDPAGLQPLPASASDSQHHAAAHPSSAGPAQSTSPHLSAQTGPGAAEPGEEEDQTAPPSSPALPLPGTDRARSPSPQFAPLRLTDRPPAGSVGDDSQLSSQTEPRVPAVMDVSGPLRKVPIRIVHAESSSERQGQAYLPRTGESCVLPEPAADLSPLTAPVSSLFSAYTRHDPQEPAPDPPSGQETAGAHNLEEDAKREELVRDIMGRDKSLVDILDQSGRKTTMDLMEGLFPPEEKILEGVQLRRRTSVGSRVPATSRRDEEDVSLSASASLVPSSSYYNTSAPKAELLIKMKDMREQLEEQDSEDELDVDLASKKQELISSLARKLEVLREARQSLQEDVEDNEALGREVEATVRRLCRPNQLDKFCMFVGDLDKVVSLLLSLSGRLARVENALNSLEDEAPPEEKRTLTEKRKLLMRQHDDAKELKENLDRRERLVSGIMEAHLDAESLDDYRHFVKMKSALIIEQRKLEDKIKLGEEQLKCLVESLPPEQRPPLGL